MCQTDLKHPNKEKGKTKFDTSNSSSNPKDKLRDGVTTQKNKMKKTNDDGEGSSSDDVVHKGRSSSYDNDSEYEYNPSKPSKGGGSMLTTTKAKHSAKKPVSNILSNESDS
jgi:hypothetical protein